MRPETSVEGRFVRWTALVSLSLCFAAVAAAQEPEPGVVEAVKRNLAELLATKTETVETLGVEPLAAPPKASRFFYVTRVTLMVQDFTVVYWVANGGDWVPCLPGQDPPDLSELEPPTSSPEESPPWREWWRRWKRTKTSFERSVSDAWLRHKMERAKTRERIARLLEKLGTEEREAAETALRKLESRGAISAFWTLVRDCKDPGVRSLAGKILRATVEDFVRRHVQRQAKTNRRRKNRRYRSLLTSKDVERVFPLNSFHRVVDCTTKPPRILVSVWWATSGAIETCPVRGTLGVSPVGALLRRLPTGVKGKSKKDALTVYRAVATVLFGPSVEVGGAIVTENGADGKEVEGGGRCADWGRWRIRLTFDGAGRIRELSILSLEGRE